MTGKRFIPPAKSYRPNIRFEIKHFGEWLGYPKCCIEAFEKTLEIREPGIYTPLPANVMPLFRGTGFMPCLHCNENAIPEAILLHINENRKSTTLFPAHAWNEVEAKAFKEFCDAKRATDTTDEKARGLQIHYSQRASGQSALSGRR